MKVKVVWTLALLLSAALTGGVALALAQSPQESKSPATDPMPVPVPVTPFSDLDVKIAPPAMPAKPGPAAYDSLKDVAAPITPTRLTMADSETPRLAVGEQAGPETVISSGRQDPAVSIEWLGSPNARVGQPSDYNLLVRNTGPVAVHQVLVRVRLSGTTSVMATEPRAVVEETLLMWDLGVLQPRQEKTLQLRLANSARGEVTAQAWVTFTGNSALHVRVREPLLRIQAQAPEKVVLGDEAALGVTVTNTGDGPAEKVKFTAVLPAGLEDTQGGKSLTVDVGTLAPGESRRLPIPARARAAGEQVCQFSLEGEGGLKCHETLRCQVLEPKLALQARAPRLRYLDRKAAITLRVQNPGDAAVGAVAISGVLPENFRFLNADHDGKFDAKSRTVSWTLNDLAPGETRALGLEVSCVAPGEVSPRFQAQAARGLRAECQVGTRIEGLSAVQLEIVDLEDPIEVGSDTTYEIRLTNTGSQNEADVRLVCVLPPERVELKSVTGPFNFHVEGQEIAFDPIPQLAPHSHVVYRVTVKGLKPGIALFKARVSSAVLTVPVTKEEATRIYED